MIVVSIIHGKSSGPQPPPILRLSRLSRLSTMMSRGDRSRGGPEEAPPDPHTRPRFAPAAAPRTPRAPRTEMAPDPGLLRATKEGGKPQTQLRWVSRVQLGGGSRCRHRLLPAPNRAWIVDLISQSSWNVPAGPRLRARPWKHRKFSDGVVQAKKVS